MWNHIHHDSSFGNNCLLSVEITFKTIGNIHCQYSCNIVDKSISVSFFLPILCLYIYLPPSLLSFLSFYLSSSLSNSLSLSLSLPLSISLSHPLSLYFSLSLSLTHTHTHTHNLWYLFDAGQML